MRPLSIPLMKTKRQLFCLCLFPCLLRLSVALAFPAAVTDAAQRSVEWPPVTTFNKPWAYWHWMGSAVDETNLVHELNRYAKAGLGGMHIIPIYGAKGWEDRYISYLSPEWMRMLGLTVQAARELGMDIDMTTGTGWNFGGPNIPLDLSCLRLAKRTVAVPPGQKPPRLGPRADLLAVLVESNNIACLDLTDKVSVEGELEWTAPGPGLTLSVCGVQRGQPEVERAAPGGEGPLLNPFYRVAIDRYLTRFESAFETASGPRPRSMYNDSYEYHGAAWSPDLYDQFAQRRGYRLDQHRADLFGSGTNDTARRVRADYRETLSDLVLESMTQPWVEWSHRHGFINRNQAHGSPANLLDLYAAADIPETEMFFKDRDILVSKFASSAAHVAGHKLVAAETGTWVAEHFTETLADLKRNVDDLFLAGVNHVFFHGTCYSPDEAGWPGWLFYAATQFNPRNSIWYDVPALNSYVQRCQSLLQAGRPDNEVLLYWPIHDLWYQQEPLVAGLTVHHREWIQKQALGRVAGQLWARGRGFDYISDLQLATANTRSSRVVLPGGEYRVIVVPACNQMSVQTLQCLLGLARAGATVIFEGRLPQDVPGFSDLPRRRQALHGMLDSIQADLKGHTSLRQTQLGQGRICVGDLETALKGTGLARETLTDREGLLFVRRADRDERCYFILNKSRTAFSDWLPLAVSDRCATLLDPMTSRSGSAASRVRGGHLEVFLQLKPGEALFVRTSSKSRGSVVPWTYAKPTGTAVELGGDWKLHFTHGGPELPPDLTAPRLASWTELGGEPARRFAGSALYTLTFDAPTAGDTFLLDLGQVAQSSRVRLNGRELGTLILPPFQVGLDQVKPRGNLLEIEVTSVAANRIRDLDCRGVKWKNFHEINFVDINYRPFDASRWPLRDAGLLGPVTLQPLATFTHPK
jgi:hypothetical protein